MPQLVTYRPVRSNWKTQGFYDNLACIKTDIYGNVVYPTSVVSKNVTCPIGYRDFYKTVGLNSHGGQDFACWDGEPIYHCGLFDGWMKTEIDADKGIGVWVISQEPILYCKECKAKHHVKHQSWHCSKVEGYDNMMVMPGQIIARGGSTGASSGPHVHDADKWCSKNGETIHRENGWFGAIPPDYSEDYKQEQMFILEYLGIQAKVNTIAEQVKALVLAVQKFLYGAT